jgi:hypothetical protein
VHSSGFPILIVTLKDIIMKKTWILAVALFTAVAFASCDKDECPICYECECVCPRSPVSNIVQQGTWRITFYNDSGENETFHFTGYSFTFNPDGTLMAVMDSSAITGTWRAGTDDSHQELYLHFGTTVPFEELNDDWHFLEQTSTKIRLEDISGGNELNDLLTFERVTK